MGKLRWERLIIVESRTYIHPSPGNTNCDNNPESSTEQRVNIILITIIEPRLKETDKLTQDYKLMNIVS